jgi:hypothetical protein
MIVSIVIPVKKDKDLDTLSTRLTISLEDIRCCAENQLSKTKKKSEMYLTGDRENIIIDL